MEPPAYQNDPPPPPESHNELPDYIDSFQDATVSLARAPRLSTHVYGIRKKKGEPEWLILRVTSRSKSAENLPLCIEGDPVVGSVELNLAQETTVKFVNVTLTGDLITADSAQTTFLTLSQQLWSCEQGDHPRGTTVDDQENREPTSVKGKVTGRFSWPFALEIPSKVHLSTKKMQHTYNSPPSFLERGARVTVMYRLLVTIGRGKLQPPSSVDTVLHYVPRLRPGPPSSLRQLAYHDRAPLFESNADPDGWHTLQHVLFRGLIFNSREVSVKSKLSLARPLCYTRGSNIPLTLTLQCSDEEALDLLLVQKSIRVCLQRTLVVLRDGILAPGKRVIAPYTDTILGTAVWWPSPHAEATDSSTLVRALQGEIVLPKSLAPTAHLDRFAIHYKVLFLPFKAAGFTTEHPLDVPLQEISVEIGTTYAHGPRPISYSSTFSPQ